MNSATKARRQAEKANFVNPKKLAKLREEDKNEIAKATTKATKWFLKNIEKISRKGFFETELYYSQEKIFKLGLFSSYVLRKDYLLLEEPYIIHSVKDNLEKAGYRLRFVNCEQPEFISGETRLEYQNRCSNARRHSGPFDGYHINSIIISW